MNKEKHVYDSCIIGGGPAGLTAAIYLARAGYDVAVFEKNFCGGRIALAGKIENYPGIESISGIEYARTLQKQVENFGCKIFCECVTGVKIIESSQKLFELTTKYSKYASKTLIIANGLEPRKLNCPGENELIGKGISFCATCDGMLYRNKKVAVVGGGDTAASDALYLSKICEKVLMIIRRPYLTCTKILNEKLINMKNVDLKFSSVIEKFVEKNGKIGSLLLRDLKSDSVYEENVDGVFLAIGYKTQNKSYDNLVKIDEDGYLVSDEFCLTKTSGVFCAGDTRKKALRQLVTAVSDGANAAFADIKYLKEIMDN